MPEIHGTENAKKFSIGSALFIVSINKVFGVKNNVLSPFRSLAATTV